MPVAKKRKKAGSNCHKGNSDGKVSDKSMWGGRKIKSCDNMPCDFFYTIPNSKLLTLMIVVAIVISVILLIVFKQVVRYCEIEKDANETVGNYLSLVALPVGVVLAFIVSSAWSTFSDAQFKENQEATQILVLYNAIRQLPGSERLQEQIKEYLHFIIDVEFPLMQEGQQSQEGTQLIFEIGNSIYDMDLGDDGKESIIYGQAIDVYETVFELRIARMTYAVDGLAPEMWWVLVLGVVIVIIVSFFVCSFSLFLQAILTALAVTALVSMLFLIVALNFPYRGDFGLDTLPFELALLQIAIEEGEAEPANDRDKVKPKKRKDRKKKHHKTCSSESSSDSDEEKCSTFTNSSSLSADDKDRSTKSSSKSTGRTPSRKHRRGFKPNHHMMKAKGRK